MTNYHLPLGNEKCIKLGTCSRTTETREQEQSALTLALSPKEREGVADTWWTKGGVFPVIHSLDS